VAQDYRARLLIPETRDPVRQLFTRAGTLIADGYVRVVIGARGPYVEIDNEQIWRSRLRVPAAEVYRFNDPHVFYATYRSNDDSDVKVYWQKKPVDYADYQVGMYYVSPFDLVDREGGELIAPLQKAAAQGELL
jgi:hypothetical protein